VLLTNLDDDPSERPSMRAENTIVWGYFSDLYVLKANVTYLHCMRC